MHEVVDRFAEACAVEPGAVLARSRIGPRRPMAGGDLPAITVALTVDRVPGAGVRRLEREASTLVRSVATVVVGDASRHFDAGLQSLRLDPLPLRRNPASLAGSAWSDADVVIRNVTAATPVSYRLIDRPASVDEFALDAARGVVAFGAPQRAGDRLEVAHWTLELRDDVTCARFAGAMRLEVWGSTASDVETIARTVQARVSRGRALFRQRGFARLSSSRLDPLEQVLIPSASASPIPAWRQGLEYAFAFEARDGGAVSAGGRIQRIDVAARGDVSEMFSVP